MSLLEAHEVHKSYPTARGALTVLRGVSLSVDAGDSVAMMGPSGCGKSTLLNIMGTLESPDSGRVSIGGEDPFALDERGLASFRNRRVGFVFQDHHLLPQCNVLENVLLPTLAEQRSSDATGRAKSLLERVGLADRLDHQPSELSGGERQRVAIARALINQPAVLLADEPTGNLDRETAETVADLLVEIHRDEQTVLIVVTHSERLAAHFARRMDLSDGVLAPHG